MRLLLDRRLASAVTFFATPRNAHFIRAGLVVTGAADIVELPFPSEDARQSTNELPSSTHLIDFVSAVAALGPAFVDALASASARHPRHWRLRLVHLASIPSLEEELSWVTSELAAAQARARDIEEEKKKTTSEQLDKARREAERAKASAWPTQEEVAAGREDARVARVAVQAMEARLEAVSREVLAAKASAKTAAPSAGAHHRGAHGLAQQEPRQRHHWKVATTPSWPAATPRRCPRPPTGARVKLTCFPPMH